MVAPARAIPVGLVVVRVPPQTATEALATVSPAGRVSVNATPVSATVFATGFVIVKVNEVVVPVTTVEGVKIFAIDGGATTVMLAVAELPVPPFVEVTLLVVFVLTPADVPSTFTWKLQELLAAKLAPERLTELLPATAVIVPPPQVPVKPLGVETTMPAGKLSVNAMPLTVMVVLGFVTVKVKVVVPLSGIVAAPKALAKVGAATTVMLAFEVLPVPPSVEVTCTLLFFTPAVVPSMVTPTVQLALAASVPPLRLT